MECFFPPLKKRYVCCCHLCVVVVHTNMCQRPISSVVCVCVCFVNVLNNPYMYELSAQRYTTKRHDVSAKTSHSFIMKSNDFLQEIRTRYRRWFNKHTARAYPSRERGCGRNKYMYLVAHCNKLSRFANARLNYKIYAAI